MLNYFLDTRCIFCGRKSNKSVCSVCISFLYSDIKQKKCDICGHPVSSESCISCNGQKQFYDKYIFFQYYSDFSKSFVYKWKKNGFFVIGKFLAERLICELDNENYIVFVPNHRFKFLKKGRSGLGFIKQKLKSKGYNILTDLLIEKVILFSNQKTLSKENRINNVKKKFSLNKKYKKIIKKRNIKLDIVYLIDDVYTTGSTVNHCSKLLMKAGFKKVICITFFRSVIYGGKI